MKVFILFDIKDCYIPFFNYLQKKYPDHILDPRGRGTFVAFTSPTPEVRDKISAIMRNLG